MQNENDFVKMVGVWRLLEYRIRLFNSYSETVLDGMLGQLVYTESGHVSVVISRKPDQIKSLSDVIAYAGKYVLDAKHVRHSIFVSNLAKYVESTQIREFSYDGDVFELKTIDRSDGVHLVKWERQK